MRIARIGNLLLPVPAEGYGGTERSMAQMTVLQASTCGHDITLYAAADSTIIAMAQDLAGKMGLSCRLEASDGSLAIVNADGRQGRITLKSAGISSMGVGSLEPAFEKASHQAVFTQFVEDENNNPFDIIHCHTRRFMASDILPRGLGSKTIVHQHNPGLEPSYKEHPYPLICISNSQAASLRKLFAADIVGVIRHGLDGHAYQATTEHAGYLAWIGRFLPEKGADRAIQIAIAAKLPLLIAGMVFDKKSESARHFEEDIKPHIDRNDASLLDRMSLLTAAEVRKEIAKAGTQSPVIFCGEANETGKQALFGHAQATLFPISWPEPFGRVLIESMACGTPVVGYAQLGDVHCGSVGEVIENGVSGYTIYARDESDGVQRAVEAVQTAGKMDRALIRKVFDRDWTSARVAKQLDVVYKRFLQNGAPGAEQTTATRSAALVATRPPSSLTL